jgi:integrase
MEGFDLHQGIIRVLETKTGKTRNIVLNSDMVALLGGLPVSGEYVFPGRNGKPFKDVKRSFLTALNDAGIEQSEDRRQKIVFHTLRHTCISLLTERGADTTMVKNDVAHASEEMTERYTHLSEEYARRTGDILNGLFEVQKLLWKQNGNNAQSAIA